ncbi:hypothetical protein [Nocardia brasiliensis]|uniref:hypothetical protein n=1 Tax=Nocardia brasiliensis TaxID=37326 RepID=UPI002457C5A3|nr:hypothetical protein [Nocardia brasiliensis]
MNRAQLSRLPAVFALIVTAAACATSNSAEDSTGSISRAPGITASGAESGSVYLAQVRGAMARNSPIAVTELHNLRCGTVVDAGGSPRTVTAVATAAGRVGCTEAIDVAADYVRRVADTDVAEIGGWWCNAQPDADMPAVCVREGLMIGLGAS